MLDNYYNELRGLTINYEAVSLHNAMANACMGLRGQLHTANTASGKYAENS